MEAENRVMLPQIKEHQEPPEAERGKVAVIFPVGWLSPKTLSRLGIGPTTIGDFLGGCHEQMRQQIREPRMLAREWAN